MSDDRLPHLSLCRRHLPGAWDLLALKAGQAGQAGRAGQAGQAGQARFSFEMLRFNFEMLRFNFEMLRFKQAGRKRRISSLLQNCLMDLSGYLLSGLRDGRPLSKWPTGW